MTHGHRTDGAAGAIFIRRGPQETRLDFVRRREVMLAGWENDTRLRDRLGSSEQATWWAGRCAADPALVHPYGPTRNGKSLGYGSWSDDILAMRAAFAPKPQPPVAGTDARETTRELSDEALATLRDWAQFSIDDHAAGQPFSCGSEARIELSAKTVLALVAGYRRAKP